MPRPSARRASRRTSQASTNVASCDEPSPAPASRRGLPHVIVIIVLVLASALVREGRPVVMILQLLAGAGLIATELIRRLADIQD